MGENSKFSESLCKLRKFVKLQKGTFLNIVARCFSVSRSVGFIPIIFTSQRNSSEFLEASACAAAI